MRALTCVAAAALLSTAAGCGDSEPVLDQSDAAIAPQQAERPEPAEAPRGLTVENIRRANVGLPSMGTDRVTLRNGTYQRESPFRLVTLEEGTLAWADVDQDELKVIRRGEA